MPRWLRDAAMIGLLAMAVFVPYLSAAGYRITDLEVPVIGLSALLLGGACGALLSRWPWLMHLLAALLACWLADFYFFDRSALAGLTALVVFVGLSSRYEPNLRFQLTVFSLGFSLLMLPFAWRPYLQPALDAGPATATEAPAPLIHLILDEYVAPEAQPPVGRMRGFEQTLRDDYLQRGFALYRSTRSVSGWSPISLGRTMRMEGDGRTSPEGIHGDDRRYYDLPDNPYFDWLQRHGYQMETIESEYLDLCAGRPDCHRHRYAFADHGHAMARFHGRLRDRLYIALMQLHFRALLSEGTDRVGVWRWLLGEAIDAGDQPERTRSPAMLEVFDQVEHYVATAPLRGRALIVHVLLPHFPWLLDEHCELMPRADWRQPIWATPGLIIGVDETPYIESYWRQAACAHRRTMRIIDTVLARPDARDAIFIIHGDHGSRIRHKLPEPSAAELAADAPSESLDTLFAVRSPRIAAGLIEARQTLPQRFREVLPAAVGAP